MMIIDKLKLLLSILLVVFGVVGFYLLAEHAAVFRVLSVLVGVLAGGFVFSLTAQGQTFIGFFKDSIAEARRVVWPTQKETIQTTAVVFTLVVVMAIFLWIVDVGFFWMVKTLMGRDA